MRLTRLGMFLLLNGAIATGLIIYFGAWMFSRTITGQLAEPFFINKVTVAYQVNGVQYKGTYMRNGIPYSQKKIPIRYLIVNPSKSRINSFMGIWAEPLAWWSVFLLASVALLLTRNVVFTKGTIFILQKKFPWISMEEYFPLPGTDESETTRRKWTIRKKFKLIGKGEK